MSATNPQAVLQALSDEYQKLQTGRSRQHQVTAPQAYATLSTALSDLSTAVQNRERLEAQQQENLGVKKVSPNLLAPFAS